MPMLSDMLSFGMQPSLPDVKRKRLMNIALWTGMLLVYFGGWVLIYGWTILPAAIFDAMIMGPIYYGIISWQQRQKQRDQCPRSKGPVQENKH